MQTYDWNDLKHLLALYRHGTLKAAARVVETSETTVSRRIKALEQALGIPLFLFDARGRYEPTDAALAMIAHAERIERESLLIAEHAGKGAQAVAGRVRVSSVPIIVNSILVQAYAAFAQVYPSLTVELVPASENVDLSKREADLAVRFARPFAGGLQTKAQKLGALEFGAYVARSLDLNQINSLRWIAYDDAHAWLPQARWIDNVMKSTLSPAASLAVADADTALEAVANGLGKSLLPRVIADADPRLQRVTTTNTEDLPVRELWLLSHQDQAARASVSVVKDWLLGLSWS